MIAIYVVRVQQTVRLTRLPPYISAYAAKFPAYVSTYVRRSLPVYYLPNLVDIVHGDWGITHPVCVVCVCVCLAFLDPMTSVAMIRI